jgi:hypothetical protein
MGFWAFLGALGGGALAVLLAVLVGLTKDEVKGRIPGWGRRLLGRASRQLPPETRTRYEEEWLAEFAAQAAERPLSAVCFALGVYLKAGNLRRELSPEPATAEVRADGEREPSRPAWRERLISRVAAGGAIAGRVGHPVASVARRGRSGLVAAFFTGVLRERTTARRAIGVRPSPSQLYLLLLRVRMYIPTVRPQEVWARSIRVAIGVGAGAAAVESVSQLFGLF